MISPVHTQMRGQKYGHLKGRPGYIFSVTQRTRDKDRVREGGCRCTPFSSFKSADRADSAVAMLSWLVAMRYAKLGTHAQYVYYF